MSDIKTITLPNGSTYDLRDSHCVIATSASAGLVQPDNTTIIINNNGEISTDLSNLTITYEEITSVGLAKTGTAKTGTPNYTPSGQIDYTTGSIDVSVTSTLNYSFSNYVLEITGVSASASVNGQVVTGINGFVGNGVHFIIEQEESE